MPRKQQKRKTGLRGRGAYYPGGRTLSGKGGFFQDLGGALKSIIKPVASLAGGALNTVIPGSGDVISGITRLVGLGAYKPVKMNAMLQAQPVPRVGSAIDDGITYTHTEYLGDITSSTDFELTQLHVNPGLPETFPWLSQIAANFQKWQLLGGVFYIRSTSSGALAGTSNLALGTVLGGAQYEPNAPPPASKPEMMQLAGSLSGKPSDDHIYPLECDPGKNLFGTRLIRHGGVSDDIAKYDLCTFNLATEGAPGEYNLGELWWSYRVKLMAPKSGDQNPFMRTGSSPSAIVPVVIPAAGSDVAPRKFPLILKDVSTHGTFVNTLTWTTETLSDGLPAYKIPAGTNGYFLLTLKTFNGNDSMFLTGDTVTTATAYADVVNSSGAVSIVEAPYNIHSNNEMEVSLTQVYRIAALPDRPMYLRLGVVIGNAWLAGTTMDMNIGMAIVRLSDKWMPDPTTGSGVVPALSKIRRGKGSVVTF